MREENLAVCEACGEAVLAGQAVWMRDGRVVGHSRCPRDARAEADAVDLAIDDWKLNKKY